MAPSNADDLPAHDRPEFPSNDNAHAIFSQRSKGVVALITSRTYAEGHWPDIELRAS